ncbi:MAG: hypothetical protein V8Q84_00135 [Bilophila sp.]
MHEALKLTAQLVLQVHESQSPVYDLLRGAGMLTPELARIQHDQRCRHRDDQEKHVRFLLRERRLKENITISMALDVFWCLTSRDVYQMLVPERGWSGETYTHWLYEMLVSSLLDHSEARPRMKKRSEAGKGRLPGLHPVHAGQAASRPFYWGMTPPPPPRGRKAPATARNLVTLPRSKRREENIRTPPHPLIPVTSICPAGRASARALTRPQPQRRFPG